MIRFGRFRDARGYFTEHYRRSDLRGHPGLGFLRDFEFVQANESFSRRGTIRGLHFQWSPFMGKLVRTVAGRMIDLVLDVRKGSPTLGHVVAWDMPADRDAEEQEWIWVPPGFAHGNVFPEDTVIEYLCTGEYSPGCEACVSPLAADLDWSLCAPSLRREFEDVARAEPLISDKDRDGDTLAGWLARDDSERFRYGRS